MEHNLSELLRDVPETELLLLAARSNKHMRSRIARVVLSRSRSNKSSGAAARLDSSRSPVLVSSPSRS